METAAAWDDLPNELLASVFCFLDFSSLHHCFSVNKRWHSAATDDMLWQHFFHQLFGGLPPAEEAEEEEAAKGQQPKTWLQRFRSFAEASPDYKTLRRDAHKGCCPKAILSTELQLKKTGFQPLPVVEEKKNEPSISGLQDPDHYHEQTKEKRLESEVKENKAMFMDWAGKVVELQFRACKNWEVGLFHNPESFHRFTTTRYLANGGGVAELYPAVVLSIAEKKIYRSEWKEGITSNRATPPLAKRSTDAELEAYFTDNSSALQPNIKEPLDRYPFVSQIATDAGYDIMVRIDGRANTVSFALDGEAVGETLPTPPAPFAMVFSTGYALPEMRIVKQSVSFR
ncbi:hypothetical protein QOT17_024276 [Balamuthia mandrillaris]